MKSIEIIVPRNLIKKFYLHPEPYGDGSYVIDLVNGMYTDVFYREEGDFITNTNDTELISYLKKNQMDPRGYFFRNGVFSFRLIENNDSDLFEEWNSISPIHIQMNISRRQNVPSEFIFCFYWIEVGKVKVETDKLTFDIHEKDFIQMIDIAVALDWLQECVKQVDSQ
ncbi:MAG: hypothetical protein RBQ63_00040 [Acholeplasmatales bacterium]|nr:hypothetical protein [Acholeplasmatales bacterium]